MSDFQFVLLSVVIAYALGAASVVSVPWLLKHSFAGSGWVLAAVGVAVVGLFAWGIYHDG